MTTTNVCNKNYVRNTNKVGEYKVDLQFKVLPVSRKISLKIAKNLKNKMKMVSWLQHKNEFLNLFSPNDVIY